MIGGHFPDNCFREHSRLCRDSNQNGRFEIPDGIFKIVDMVVTMMRKKTLFGRDATGRPAFRNQTARIHEEERQARLFDGYPRLFGNRHGGEIGNSQAGFSGAGDQHNVFRQLFPADAVRCQNAGEGDGGCALHVVVECAAFVLVLFQQTAGVMIGKVLPLDKGQFTPLVLYAANDSRYDWQSPPIV